MLYHIQYNRATALLNMDQPPLVNSISYGGYEIFYSSPYLTQFDNYAMMLAVQVMLAAYLLSSALLCSVSFYVI